MGRRKMETGDIVVVDARGVRALGIVEEISGDAEKTGGLGNASQGKWAYRVRILCGSRHADGSPVPADTDIWINDDPWDVRVDGEDGYALPEHFQGEDVARLLAKAGVARKSMISDEEGAWNRRKRRTAIIKWIIAVVCVVAVVLGAGVMVKRHWQQVAEQQRQGQLDNLIDSTDLYALGLLRQCGDLQTISTGLGAQYATVAPRTDGLDSATLGCMLESMGEQDTAANELSLWRALIGASVGNLVTNRKQLESLPWQTVMDIEIRCGMGFDSGVMCDVRSGDESFGEGDTNGGASSDDSASNGSASTDASPSSTNSSEEAGAQSGEGEFDPDNVRGRWCRKDGVTCVVITPQTEGQAMPLVLDTSQMGDANPLPDGQTSTLMVPNYQSQQDPETLRRQFHMVTEYTYRIDCSTQTDASSCDGETVHKPAYDQSTGAPASAGVIMVQKPLEVVRVGPDNTLPVEGIDASNPPAQVAYLIIKPYGEAQPNSVSDDMVFYSRMT